MSYWRPKITDNSPRLFDNDFLELLTRTHPAIVFGLYTPVGLALIWYSVMHVGMGVWQSIGLASVGAIAWTFTEYWLHRTIMHWIPESVWGPRLHFWVHGIHHQWPNDPYRLVMPPAVSVSLFFIFLGLWYLLLGRYAWAFHGGFTLGYVTYDMAHYWYHHSKPRQSWARSLQRHHLMHHFNKRYDERHFAITVPLWDRLFGTGRLREDQ